MLKARGETVKKIIGDDDTVELTVDDVIGRDALSDKTDSRD